MLSPFQVQADLAKQAQAFSGGQTGGGDRLQAGVITILNIDIPCTHSPSSTDFNLVVGGQSPMSYVDQCEFLVSDVPQYVPQTAPQKQLVLRKGVKCILRQNPDDPGIRMQLWNGGVMPGGLIYRFTLVDENYKA